jgi:hypothetical protein
MPICFRRFAASFLAFFAILFFSAPTRAAAPQSIAAVKVAGYLQTGPGENFAPSESSFDLELRFDGDATGTSATLTSPNGSHTIALVESTTMGFGQTVPNPTSLENSFPNGSYSATVSGGGTFTFTFPATTLPPVAITNYAALQNITDPNVTISWGPLPSIPVAESVVLLEVFRANGEVVWRSGGLNSASREVTLSGLPAGQSLYGVLTYAHAPLTTNDNFIYAVARATSVRFSIGTSNAPGISVQPLSQALDGRNSLTLSVGVVDSTGVSFQWSKDGSPVAGATEATLSVTTPGFYTVAVTNSHGTTTSNAAIVTATAASSDEARLYAISCRARVGVGGDVLIPGIAIGGTGQRQVLVRAGGPSIQGVNGTLAQPQLRLYVVGNSTPIASNTGWSSGSASETAALQAAFVATNLPSYPLGSADCALIATVSAGSAYTATVSGVNNTTGVGLVEVYELGAGSARLTALSCRAQVGTGADVLIPGIIVTGSSAKTLIVRAKGPSIEGVAGVLAQPKLELFNGSGVRIAENTGWNNAPNVAAISAATAATGLMPFPAGSADCAMVVTLPPGGYTAKISGVNDSTGVALVEVYEVP